MSPETVDLGETELTLALPGTPIKASYGRQKPGNKRMFLESVDLRLGEALVNNYNSTITNGQLVGWPPVKTVRRKYVKVAVDGAAYLRKVDLEMYNCYEQLLTALENMFQGIIKICKVTPTEVKMEKSGVHNEFMATYEDKDGDLMLVGDVPWIIVQTYKIDENTDSIGLVTKWILFQLSRT